MTEAQIEAQIKLDKINSELNELWRQIYAKEAERDKYDRIVHPEDYEQV